VAGVRTGGTPEVQLLTISTDAGSVTGWFRLLFDSSFYTNYIPADAEEAEVKTALEQLAKVRQVEVSRSTVLGGFSWAITFSTNVGDLPALVVDSTKLVQSGTLTVTVADGNNAVDQYGDVLCTVCRVGERPVQYGYKDIEDIDVLQTLVTGLHAGTTYHFSMSSFNEKGWGVRALATPGTITPPLQVPGTPTSVVASVKSWLASPGDNLPIPSGCC